MLKEIKSVIRRSQSTLLQDAVGAGALMLMLMVALHIPGFV